MPDETPDMPPDEPSDSSSDPSLHQSDDHFAELGAALPAEQKSDIGVYTCPHCNQMVAVDPDERGPFIVCPYCGDNFAIVTPQAAERHEAREVEQRARDAELDGMRIRQVAMARRAAIRARTYLVIGVVACLSGAEELIRKIVIAARHGHAWDRRTFAFAIIAIVALMGAGRLWARAVEIGRELRRPLLENPTEPPDFTGLSDGSQQWKDLEDVR